MEELIKRMGWVEEYLFKQYVYYEKPSGHARAAQQIAVEMSIKLVLPVEKVIYKLPFSLKTALITGLMYIDILQLKENEVVP